MNYTQHGTARPLDSILHIPSVYRIFIDDLGRRDAFLAIRIIWWAMNFVWLYFETHAPVSLFSASALQNAWLAMIGWAAVSCLLTGYYTYMRVGGRARASSGATTARLASCRWVFASVCWLDALVIGLVIGMTGVSYSIEFLPAMIFLLALLIFADPIIIAATYALIIGAAVAGIPFSIVGDAWGDVSWGWAAAGIGVVSAIGGVFAYSVRRYGRQAVQERLYQNWLEQLNTAIFDLMPAGAVICDSSGLIRHVNPFIMAYIGHEIEAGVSIFHLSKTFEKFTSLDELAREEHLVHLVSEGVPEGKWFQAVFRKIVLRDEDAEPLYLVMLYDVTESRRRQEEAELKRKWAAFQNISAGLVHEIRNPLGAISGVINTVLESPQMKDDERQRLVHMVQYESDRLGRLVQDFLDSLGTTLVIRKKSENALALCESFYKLVSQDPRVVSDKVRVIFNNRLKREMSVYVDKDRMFQVFHNLFQNAVYAVIAAGRQQEGVVMDVEEAPEDDGVIIRFTDYGVGMDPELLPQMFDPFFTTKESGTGLGLSIAYRIVDAHDGQLRAKSALGRYTHMEIFLSAGGGGGGAS